MGKFKKFAHTFVVHCLVVSLTIWSLPPKVEAQDILEGDNLGKAIIGVTKTVGQQMMNIKMQNAAMMQQAAIMQKMQPKLVPARFFPQCQVPQSFNPPPEGVCDQVQSPMQLGSMMGYQQLAFKYDDLYTQMSSPAQNTPFPQGLQCIEESAKRTDAEMQDKLNALTKFQDLIKKQMQAFRDENKKLIDEMDGINEELRGGPGNNVDKKKGDLAGSFSQQCQNLLGGPAAMNSIGKGKGLLGLQSRMDESVRGPANDFVANQASYKKDIDKLVSKMVKKMNADGIDNFDLTAKDIRGVNADMVTRISETFQGEVASLKKFRDQIQKDIEKTGLDFEMPRFDKNFSVDFEEFRAGAKNFYQKKYVHNCVTGSDNTSLGLSAQEILSGLRQKGIRGSGAGNAVSKYRDALQNILNQDNLIEDKLAAIRALDAQYAGRGEVTVTYQNSSAKTVTTTPYQLYMETVKNCQEQFSQDNTFSTSSQGISMKKKVERVQQYLDKLKKKHDAFVADAASSITESLINCNGAKLKSGPGSCNANTMTPKAAGFCMAHAQQCAGEVNKCYNDVKARIEQKTNVLKSKAKMFNANVGTLVAKQEAILKQVTAQVGADSEFIKRFFPGANYTAPADLFVGMPETMGPNDPKNKYGVPIIGDLSKINELPQKIELLKNQLKEQKGKIQSVIKKYASEQNQAISQNQSKWKAFGAKCKATEKAFRQQMAAADAKKQQDFAEKKAEVGDFCNRYSRLKNLSPTAGCGKVEDLYSDSNNIAAHLNGDVLGSLDAYSNVCAGRDNGDDEDQDKTPKIKKMCDRYSWDQIKKQTLDNLLEKLPGDIAGHKNKIKKYVLEGSPERLSDISKDVANSDYADYILNARKLHELQGEGSSPAGQIDRLAERMRNAIKNDDKAKARFEGLIDNFASAQNKTEATNYVDRIIDIANDGASTNADTTNGRNITLLNTAIDKLNAANPPTSNDLGLSGFQGTRPATMDTKVSEYEAARSAYVTNERTIRAASIPVNPTQGGSQTTRNVRFEDVDVIKADGTIGSRAEVKAKVQALSNPAIPSDQVEAVVSSLLGDSRVSQYEEKRSKFVSSKSALAGAMRAHVAALQDNPLKDLLAEAESAKSAVGEMTSDFSRAPASEGGGDICANMDKEVEQVAKDECAGADNPRDCERKEEEELVVNSTNGVSSKLRTTSQANDLLTSLDQGRGIASAQDWSAIGENSSDACEATAANGRNFGGLDLSEFDLSTGAVPLGGMGSAQ